MLSGIYAAEAAIDAIELGRFGDELSDYEKKVRNGYISKDLRKVKNVKPLWSKYGLMASLIIGALDMWIASLVGRSPFGTMRHQKSDSAATGKAKDFKKIDYPKVDGIISFDRSTNVSFSNTNHEDNQPCHLQLLDPKIPIAKNLIEYAEPAQKYCPAGVYEVVERKEIKGLEFQINSQNCVHCKTCDIKDPSQNINWVTPNGGDGPNYSNM